MIGLPKILTIVLVLIIILGGGYFLFTNFARINIQPVSFPDPNRYYENLGARPGENVSPLMFILSGRGRAPVSIKNITVNLKGDGNTSDMSGKLTYYYLNNHPSSCSTELGPQYESQALPADRDGKLIFDFAENQLLINDEQELCVIVYGTLSTGTNLKNVELSINSSQILTHKKFLFVPSVRVSGDAKSWLTKVDYSASPTFAFSVVALPDTPSGVFQEGNQKLIGKFVFGNQGNVPLEIESFSVARAGTMPPNIISNITIYRIDNNEVIARRSSFDPYSASFDNLKLIIPANGKVEIAIRADIIGAKVGQSLQVFIPRAGLSVWASTPKREYINDDKYVTRFSVIELGLLYFK